MSISKNKSLDIATLRTAVVVGAVTVLLVGCIQRDRQEVVDRVEEPAPLHLPFNTRMPRTVGVHQARRMLKYDDEIVLVDVRDGLAWSKGILKGAIHLPEELVAANALREFSDLDTRILLYSIPGRGSVKASATLRELGYRNVGRLEGDWQRWKAAGLEVGKPTTTSRFLFPAEKSTDPAVDVEIQLKDGELPFPQETAPPKVDTKTVELEA